MAKLMNNIMRILILLIGLFIDSSINSAQINKLDIDQQVVSYLKKNSLRVELFELSFCVKELVYILDQDTSYYKKWDELINILFDKRHKSEELFVRIKEITFLRNRMLNDSSLVSLYPKAYQYLLSKIPTQNININKKFNEIFKICIDVPEKVDYMCLVSLICDFNESIFIDINNDKIALWKYNNWLEYGFAEFRYYPGILNKSKGIINQRIINYISEKYKESKNPLIIKTLGMFNEVKNQYK
jgi:hypothetical protein